MRSTARLDQWIRSGHRVTSRAELLRWSASADRPLIGTFDVLDGRIRIDRQAQQRRTLELTAIIDNPDWHPARPGSPIAPYGNEIRIRSGIFDPTATGGDERITAGVFGIESAVVVDAGSSLTVRITGADRSRRIARSGFEAPWSTTPGETFSGAIERLIGYAAPGTPISVPNNAGTAPRLVWEVSRANPWTAIQELAQGLGLDAVIDPDGQLVVAGTSSSGVSAWSFAEGPRNTAVSIEASLSAEEGFNGVVVTGEASGHSPVRAVRWDDIAGSPTHYLGPYGRRPKYVTTNSVTSQGAADSLAATELAKLLGATEKISLSAIPHPGLDVGDVVDVTRSRADQAGSKWVIDSIDLPLGHGQEMSIAGRRWVEVVA